jgi:Rrf2 family iron-sulfur cluster assembly transcriptional regulator
VDEQVDLTNCEKKGNCANGQPCMTHDLWMGLSETVSAYLEGISLGQLLDKADDTTDELPSVEQQVVHFQDAGTIGMAIK